MSRKLELWIEEVKKKHGKKKIWTRIISLMMAFTVFTTTYVLILPAIALDKTFCGIDEHVHSVDNGCYKEHKSLICTEEGGHTHTEGCYEEQSSLTCGLEESEGHTHGADCYDEDGILICPLDEGEGHQHSKDCYGAEKVLICGQEEAESTHVHTDSCYETTLELTCQKEEHRHTKACYSNPDADVETASDWESSISGVKLTGDWGKDVLAIADSQLGYTESVKNYQVEEDGTIKGYTRYGAWYGSPHGDWCAMFVSFCLNYAQVDRDLMPIDANCGTWIDKLEEMKVYHRTGNGDDKSAEGYKAPEEYTPKPGDVIFFDWENDGNSDHVGLVYELIKDEEGNLSQVKTIEGNSADKVRYNTYDLTDEIIMGYGKLPEKYTLPEPTGFVEGTTLERDVPKLEFAAVEENRELLDYYLSPVVRVLVPVDMKDKTFKQAVPTDRDIPNDSFYRFGYNAQKDAEKLYSSEELVIYTAYASPMEYPDRVVITYRVFGSVGDGEKAWYVCDEKGNITHRVEEKEVEWDLKDFDILKAGKYKITGTVQFLKDDKREPLKAELDVTVSELPEIPNLEDGHEH